MEPSQQNTPLDPRQQNTPLTPGAEATPLNPSSPSEPVSSPIAQQPLQGQGLTAGQMPQQEMATPEQKQELIDMLDATRDKMAELQSAKFASENEREVARVETLKEIFIMMRDAGVDLNNPASVGSFLDRLRSANPSMSAMFEETLEDLLADDVGLDEQQMGQAPQSFEEGAPQQGMPDAGMPMPTPEAPAAAPDSMLPPTMPAPTVAPAPASPAGPSGLPNETLPENVRGPLPQ